MTLTGIRDLIPGMFSLLVLAAGWYYIFYSNAAKRLEGIENQRLNQLRVRLRRAGGLSMMLLAVVFYAGFYSIEPTRPLFAVLWLSVILLLMIVVILGLIDLRLTRRLREQLRKHHP